MHHWTLNSTISSVPRTPAIAAELQLLTTESSDHSDSEEESTDTERSDRGKER